MNANNTFPLKFHILIPFEISFSLNALQVSNSNPTSIIHSSTSFLLERLDHRFPITENMVVAAFLDPSMQKLQFISSYCRSNEVDMADLLVKKWQQYEPELRIKPPNKEKQPETKKPSKVSQIRMELIRKHVTEESFSSNDYENAIHNEFLKYSSVSDIVDDPLLWWKSHEAAFPYLSALAKVMLSIPSSSGATETHFSDTGYLVNKKKANIDPLTVEKIMFIHDNFRHISHSMDTNAK